MTEDSEELRHKFSIELRNRIAELHKRLTEEEQISQSKTIESKDLKRELATVCLQVINQAEKEGIPIKATACLLGGFPFYQYGDSLDHVFRLLHEIDMQDEFFSEVRERSLLEKAKENFVRYIDSTV
ncbi:hypothetical protein Pan241w_26200 [Gimesia alba]|uniref:Uncharacterized protein n=1 Tax=Gimesia alba TaxID=2527973 RepID=A0A517RFC0_9PLAN|nr:hypothetical protein [Gimesia alba]QDT42535.1 hypothetical protein Pan241w_26200 [Gimesia alba]